MKLHFLFFKSTQLKHLRNCVFIIPRPGVIYLHTYAKKYLTYTLKGLPILPVVSIMKLKTCVPISNIHGFAPSKSFLSHILETYPCSWLSFSLSYISSEISFQKTETKSACTKLYTVFSIQWKVAKITSLLWEKLLCICTL